MDEIQIKEFSPSSGTKFLELAFGGFLFLMFFMIVFGSGSDINWLALIVILPLILLIVVVIWVDVSEIIVITADSISRHTALSNDTVLLNEIVKIEKEQGTRGNTLLLIETEQDKLRWGDRLSDEDLDEAIAFAMEQLLLHHPHRYNFVKLRRSPPVI